MVFIFVDTAYYEVLTYHFFAVQETTSEYKDGMHIPK